MPEALSNLLPKVRQKVSNLLEALGKGLYEREEAVALSFLSAVAGESIFLLGPPGIGKSLIARKLKHAFKDGTSFEYLMSKFSTPDEIFGPISIKKLKEEDKYERLTGRYLPGANVVFLDEIWKAGPAIQNALLTVLNEKIYRNGEEDLKVNIRGIISASNELPTNNANLAPIWDRFLVRYELGNIKQMGNFLNMITNTEDVYEDRISEEVKLSEQELEEWNTKIDEIELRPEVLNTIQMVKLRLIEQNAQVNASNPILVHDRRWKKIVGLLRTAAFLNGRSQVDLMDCFLIIHCLWGNPDQKKDLLNILSEVIEKHGYSMAVNLHTVKKEVRAFQKEVELETQIKHQSQEPQLLPIDDAYFQLEKKNNGFSGSLITIKQYRQLTLDTEQIINFYDADKNLVNRLKANKGEEAFTIQVYHDSMKHTYRLSTKLADSVEIITKKPHPMVQKYWDERTKTLLDFIQQQLANLDTNMPEAMKTLGANLFVSEEYLPIVTKNHRRVIEALNQARLDLEKLQFYYTSL